MDVRQFKSLSATTMGVSHYRHSHLLSLTLKCLAEGLVNAAVTLNQDVIKKKTSTIRGITMTGSETAFHPWVFLQECTSFRYK